MTTVMQSGLLQWMTEHSIHNMSFQKQVFQAIICTGTENQINNNQEKTDP